MKFFKWIAGFLGVAALATVAIAQNYTPPGTQDLVRLTRFSSTGNPGGGTNGAVPITSLFNTAGLGYGADTGAGGAVTQITSRTTGVTLNTLSGAITLLSAAGSTTPASFTVTNSKVAATDVVVVTEKSGTDLYTIDVTNIAAGSFQITSNTKSGTTTESPVFNFVVIHGAIS